MKTVVSKTKRSGVYYLMTTVAAANETRNARFDTWGVLAVIVIVFGVASLMRLILAA
jgi:hypothetical protein